MRPLHKNTERHAFYAHNLSLSYLLGMEYFQVDLVPEYIYAVSVHWSNLYFSLWSEGLQVYDHDHMFFVIHQFFFKYILKCYLVSLHDCAWL